MKKLRRVASAHVGHRILLEDADRYIGSRCAECAHRFRSRGEVVGRRARFAGKAEIVCEHCWSAFVRGAVYRKHCGV